MIKSQNATLCPTLDLNPPISVQHLNAADTLCLLVTWGATWVIRSTVQVFQSLCSCTPYFTYEQAPKQKGSDAGHSDVQKRSQGVLRLHENVKVLNSREEKYHTLRMLRFTVRRNLQSLK